MSNVYKQIPKTYDETCPICHKKATYYHTVKVLFYNQKNKNCPSTRTVGLLKCSHCNICFADKKIFEQYSKKKNNSRPIFFNTDKIKNITELNKKIYSVPILFDSNIISHNQSSKNATTHINIEDVFPLNSVNTNSSIKNIYVTHFCQNCVRCHKTLSDYVNIVPINNTSCVKIKGKYCSHCDMFFYENSSHIEMLLKDNPFALSYKINYDFFIEPSVLENDTKIKSSIYAFYLKELNSNTSKKIVVVSNKKHVSYKDDIYHYSDEIARILLTATCHFDKKQCLLNSKEYYIVSAESINNDLLKPYIVKELNISKNGGLYSVSDRSEIVDVLLYSPYNDRYEIIKASYDSEYDFYYVDIVLFKNFIKNYGNPGIPIKFFSDKSFNSFGCMKEESILHSFGYSVSQNENLSDASRQKIISDVLDLGLMTTKEIINLFDFFIKSHKDNKYALARLKWEKDTDFTINYKLNPNRFIVAEI